MDNDYFQLDYACSKSAKSPSGPAIKRMSWAHVYVVADLHALAFYVLLRYPAWFMSITVKFCAAGFPSVNKSSVC